MTEPMPVRCAGRPTVGGLVVPWISVIHNGHAVFGSLDEGRVRFAYRHRLCQICGAPLTERFFVIVRPADIAKQCSSEPALHPECLPYAAAHCPMLNGTATHYRSHSPIASHPAGRPCSSPSCPLPHGVSIPDQAARAGRPAERFEAWMIDASEYRLAFESGRPAMPTGVSLNVPVLRVRLLRRAALSAQDEFLLGHMRNALDPQDGS